jgi:hypothetical protein
MQGDSQDVYYGLLASGTPTGSVIGCGGGDGRVAAGFVGDGPTAAQEIGHAFGRRHAPCGNPGNVDANYPTYDSLPMGSIGEYGIDDRGNVQDPSTVTDFMGYCGPNWVSPYTYEGLRTRFPAVPASPRLRNTQPEESRRPEQHLFLNFKIYRNRRVRHFPSFHYESQPISEPGDWTPYVVELRDQHDYVLQALRITQNDMHRNLDDASLDFFKPIPFPESTARVVFVCDEGGCNEKELLTIDVPADPPKVKIVAPAGRRALSGKVRVAWEAPSVEEELHYLLRYSNDGGKTWRAVTSRLHEKEYEVDLDNLAGGQACLFQVLATSGIRTGCSLSETFEVPERPRFVSIAVPEGKTTIKSGEAAILVGEAFSSHHGSVPPSELEWHSDIDGPLGHGHVLDLSRLSVGKHTISLRGPDGAGGVCSATTAVEVRRTSDGKHTSASHGDHCQADHDSGSVPKDNIQDIG